MIYVFSILVCFFCLMYYDVMGKTYKRQQFFHGLLIWFIIISGFQYMLGTDMEAYMSWYKDLDIESFTLSDLISDNSQYQPGWLAFGYICRFISSDFFWLKLFQASFVNIAIFSFFKRETKHVFTAIFIYAIISYLVVNFNLMRQSIALGFALFGLSDLHRKRYIRFYVFVFFAYMFHNSSLVLIPLPIVTYFRYSKRYLIGLGTVFILGIFIMTRLDLESLVSNLLLSGDLGEDISTMGSSYMSRDRLGAQSGFSVFSVQRLMIVIIVFLYMKIHKDSFYGSLGLLYVFFLVFTGFMPILWRFRLYVDFAYYIILANAIIEFPRLVPHKYSVLLFVSIMFFVTYTPIRDYFLHVENSQYRNIDQYYPYHSIFDKEHDKKKQNFFDSLTL